MGLLFTHCRDNERELIKSARKKVRALRITLDTLNQTLDDYGEPGITEADLLALKKQVCTTTRAISTNLNNLIETERLRHEGNR